MKTLAKLEKSLSCWFLIAVSVLFFILRFPSLFEPYWYGDEGIYQVLGTAMNSGHLLYRDAFDNKPPLLYFMYSLVSSDQFMVRFLSLVFGLLAIFVFFKFAKRLFKNVKATIGSTLLFAILFGLPLIEGNIANAENFMLFPTILSAFLVYKSIDEKSDRRYLLQFIAGAAVGISFLFKIVALFDFAAFFVFLFYVNYSKKLLDIFKWENLKNEIKNLLPFTAGFLIPISLIALFFLTTGAFSYFLKATFFNNIGYVGYGNKFIIPQGLLIIKLFLLGLFSLFVFIKRESLGKPLTFASVWLAFSLFDAYFSQRPYTHYVLVTLPAFCLMFGFFLLNNKLSKFAGVLTIASFIALVMSFSFYLKTAFYYQNFVSFISGQKSVYDYQRFFDGNTPNDYALAGYINMHAKKDDNIFIWGNNAQVYKMTDKLPPGRYTVAYHITSYKDGFSNTLEGLKKGKPRFIILMHNVPAYPFELSEYYERININKMDIYEKISR
jgi:hypothetical protein